MSDVLAFVGSARRGGNTDLMVSEALLAVRSCGATARRIRLADLDMRPCMGCMRCSRGRCRTHADDMEAVLDQMLEARSLLFATPVYFWNVSGLMKTLWDRMLPVAGLDLKHRPLGMKPLLAGKRAGIIVVQEEAQGPHSSIVRLFFERNIADFGMVDAGSVFAYGSLLKGEIKKDAGALDDARTLGRALGSH